MCFKNTCLLTFFFLNKRKQTIRWTTFDPVNFFKNLPDYFKSHLDADKVDSLLEEVRLEFIFSVIPFFYHILHPFFCPVKILEHYFLTSCFLHQITSPLVLETTSDFNSCFGASCNNMFLPRLESHTVT